VLIELPEPIGDLRSLLGRHRNGPYDPTSQLSATEFVRAARTPDGPGTIRVSLVSSAGGHGSPTMAQVEVFGKGETWLAERVGDLFGASDALEVITPHHPAVADALRKVVLPRRSANRLVMPTLIGAVLGQRVTSIEAHQQWRALCRVAPESAPGPLALLLPPDPDVLAATPTWTYHRCGIERSRADTIIGICKHPGRVQEAATMSIADGYRRLEAFRGIGPWTSAVTMSAVAGDPDAVPVGDFHLKNIVSFALAGEPRGSDDRMVELLAPYAGHRGRVIELLLAAGWGAPKFGPRQPIRSISSW
jgi:3-methyladenine DNA glycosylase/8-oxoguanine DNA glycosylase